MCPAAACGGSGGTLETHKGCCLAADLWYHIGHTQELEGQYTQAKQAFEKVLEYNNTHATVLQKLWADTTNPLSLRGLPIFWGTANKDLPGLGRGWLYHNIAGLHGDPDPNSAQKLAIQYLERSVSSNSTDDAAWYLLGRCCMVTARLTPLHYQSRGALQEGILRRVLKVV